ncbi:MAG: hypothetical protein ICV66_13525, partial [Chitinophagaceae bacterium]|nr:hypothetical protein [Chitinophagaceae bacterium]
GILYLILCELLDIPVKAVNIPKQFVLAYFKHGYSNEMNEEYLSKIEFFIDPTTGQVFTHKDIEHYFKRISVPPVPSYFKPLSNKRVIQYMLEEMAKCFTEEKNRYKSEELGRLSNLLD